MADATGWMGATSGFWDTNPFAWNLQKARMGWMIDGGPADSELSQWMSGEGQEERKKGNLGWQTLIYNKLLNLHHYSIYDLFRRRADKLRICGDWGPDGIWRTDRNAMCEAISCLGEHTVGRSMLVVNSLFKTICNGWITSARIGGMGKEPCIFGCAEVHPRKDYWDLEKDELYHYLRCNRLWMAVEELATIKWPGYTTMYRFNIPTSIEERAGVGEDDFNTAVVIAYSMYHGVRMMIRSSDTDERLFSLKGRLDLAMTFGQERLDEIRFNV